MCIVRADLAVIRVVASFKTRAAKRARQANAKRKAGPRAPRPRRSRNSLPPLIRELAV